MSEAKSRGLECGPQGQGETLVQAALRVLNTADPFEKAKLGDDVANQWLQGVISQPYDPSIDLQVPDRPARPTHVKLVSPSLMPKLGKAGSLQSRQAIVHSLVHTESWAIDLSWVSLLCCYIIHSVPGFLLVALGIVKSCWVWARNRRPKKSNSGGGLIFGFRCTWCIEAQRLPKAEVQEKR